MAATAGFLILRSTLKEQFRREYGFAHIGTATGMKGEFYARVVRRKQNGHTIRRISAIGSVPGWQET